MHEKDPVISVIMGIYNCGDTLSEAIECIVNQTFSDWELIMCDDGSNDDTYEIAISYKEKYPEKYPLDLVTSGNTFSAYTYFSFYGQFQCGAYESRYYHECSYQ